MIHHCPENDVVLDIIAHGFEEIFSIQDTGT
jgi:hypothetical protein